MKNKKPLHLPVLLYHDIHEQEPETPSSVYLYNVALQFYYLKSNGFTTISVKQLIDYLEHGSPLPEKPVLLTFDDGYKSIYTIVYPLLRQHKMKATAFLVPSLVNSRNLPINTYLSIHEIKSISSEYIEWGLHSFDHICYNKLTVVQVANDVRLCINWFQMHGIPFINALAFPFGAYPAYCWSKPNKFFLGLHLCGIKVSFGTGNSLNLLGRKKTVFFRRIEITAKNEIDSFAACLQYGRQNGLKKLISNLANPALSNLRYLYNGE